MKLYMAGPLFTTAEREFNATVANVLRERGHEVWLPQDKIEQPVTAAGVFAKNIDGIEWAEAVVACLDGADPDSGTCWECGAAYRGKLVLGYRTDIRDLHDGPARFNIMLHQSITIRLDCTWLNSTEVGHSIADALATLGGTYF